MAKRDDTESRLLSILQRVVAPDIDPYSTDLNLESMKMLEVVVAVENEFGVSFPDDAPMAKVTSSLRRLSQYVRKLPKAIPAPSNQVSR